MQDGTRALFGALILTLSAAPATAERPARGDWDDRSHGRPAIAVEPSIDLTRARRPDINSPDIVMAEVAQCSEAGVRLFVDCLRGNYGPVMIRRLEACVRSETIPSDLSRVAACLPRPRLR